MSNERVTLADVETKLRSLERQATRSVTAVRPVFPGVAGVAAAALVAAAFLMGYRRGKHKSSIIEITRL
jgi:transcription initiation factor TFIIIB Brf1 subunit/transcription initiation factor TFIIB